MFVVVRSVFWLTVAYLVIRPGADLPDTGAMAAQAMAAGSQVVASQVNAIECTSLTCLGGKAVVAATLQQTAAALPPTTPASSGIVAPIPRPRPDRAG
ncbi:hypothetical protein [Devosia aquimaris]|uniref:hypothetical protein n=1 Tax=Devosia aquimaris TaxID=2866214 RepID=UPI001CD10F5C|nr:hypothetical protein [Devosia sp. CJK-A8-3]